MGLEAFACAVSDKREFFGVWPCGVGVGGLFSVKWTSLKHVLKRFGESLAFCWKSVWSVCKSSAHKIPPLYASSCHIILGGWLGGGGGGGGDSWGSIADDSWFTSPLLLVEKEMFQNCLCWKQTCHLLYSYFWISQCRFLRREKEIAETKLDVVESSSTRLQQRVTLLERQLEETKQSLSEERQQNQVLFSSPLFLFFSFLPFPLSL